MSDFSTLWTFKTVSYNERSYISNEGYADDLQTKYVYDNAVANHKQVKQGDEILIVNKTNIIGYGRISKIDHSPSTKVRRRCPVCGNTTYEKRVTRKPVYRCDKKHEFDKPLEEVVDIVQYEAFYGDSFKEIENEIPLSLLKDYYVNNYNRNMSIQRINPSFIKNHLSIITDSKSVEKEYQLSEEMSFANEPYVNTNNDDRAYRIAKTYVRPGQKEFRKNLREAYGDRCIISGCKIMDIVQAAHISPYLGENDNHVDNGLLLRVDIHILFDLGLITIDPKSLMISVDDKLIETECMSFIMKRIELQNDRRPSQSSLENRIKINATVRTSEI